MFSRPGEAAVPKFTSFKPKDEVDVVDVADPAIPLRHARRHEEESRLKSRQTQHRSGRQNRDGVKDSRPHEPARYNDKQQYKATIEREESLQRRPSNSGIRRQHEQDVSHKYHSLFFVDTRGDSQNLVYGKIHRYEVPSFHRTGAGCVLGASRRLRINKQSATEDDGIVLCSGQDELRHREKYAFSKIEKKGTKLFRIIPEERSAACEVKRERDADFISLSRRCNVMDRDSADVSEDDTQHYRSVEGKTIAAKDEDAELVSDSGPEIGFSHQVLTCDQSLQQKTISLSRAVEKQPSNLEAWLDLIRHQDSLLGVADQGRRKATHAEIRSTADIKIHLYEKALSKVQGNLADRERLLAGMMEEGSKVWDVRTQANRWRKISSENLESMVLWKKYIDFQQGNFQTFQYEQILDLYLERILQLKMAISQTREVTGISLHNDSVLLEHLVYTLLRATLLMRDAGFTELAVGIWQGLLDYNFSNLASDQQRTIRLFQDYWEAETPRIGEDGISGWQSFLARTSTSKPSPSRLSKVGSWTTGKLRKPTLFADWAKAEKFLALYAREPARTMDEVAETDPYNVVLWSDIADYILDFSAAPHEIRALLVDAFLMFAEQPPIPSDPPRQSARWWTEPFIRKIDPIVASGRSHDTSQSADNAALSEKIKDKEKFEVLPSFSPSLDTLFPMKGMPQYIPSSPAADVDTYWSVGYRFIQNTLQYLVSVHAVPGIALYLLAFELSHEPLTVKKVARNILKKNPADYELYNAYALIEAAKGNTTSAIDVVSTALSSQKSIAQPQQSHGSISLWKSWIWISLESNDIEAVRRCIFATSSGIESYSTIDIDSPSIVLKCKQHLSTEADHLLSIGKHNQAAQYTECLSLMFYFCASFPQRDIDAALAIITHFSTSLIDRCSSSTANELSLQYAARLLRYHMTTSNSYRPSTIRTFLQDALRKFPQNTILLSTYAFNEQRLRIDDRVRQTLLSTVLLRSNDCVTSRLFAIAHEFRVGNVHSQHAAFENSVCSSACASNSGLWISYVKFCVENLEYRGRAWEVFLRGIRACPWSKKMITSGMEIGAGLFDVEGLNSVYKVCMEKGLRIHVDLKEGLGEVEEQKVKGRSVRYE